MHEMSVSLATLSITLWNKFNGVLYNIIYLARLNLAKGMRNDLGLEFFQNVTIINQVMSDVEAS